MNTKFSPRQVGERYYFSLFGVGVIREITAGMTWVDFKGYRVAFNGEGRHLEIRVG